MKYEVIAVDIMLKAHVNIQDLLQRYEGIDVSDNELLKAYETLKR
jgi:hypothetical protein